MYQSAGRSGGGVTAFNHGVHRFVAGFARVVGGSDVRRSSGDSEIARLVHRTREQVIEFDRGRAVI